MPCHQLTRQIPSFENNSAPAGPKLKGCRSKIPSFEHEHIFVFYLRIAQLIKPITLSAGKVSWALMRHPEGLLCDLFITHCWEEGIFEFCDKVLQKLPVRLPQSTQGLSEVSLSPAQIMHSRAIVWVSALWSHCLHAPLAMAASAPVLSDQICTLRPLIISAKDLADPVIIN